MAWKRVVIRMQSRKIVGFSEAGYPIYDDELADQYMDLVKAIVKFARADYIKTYQKLITAKTDSKISELEMERKEIESFFFSDWFEAIVGTKCPPSYVSDLRKEAMERLKERYRKKAEKK